MLHLTHTETLRYSEIVGFKKHGAPRKQLSFSLHPYLYIVHPLPALHVS
jgi:hypothetical protein